MDERKQIYIAKFQYGWPALVRVNVAKETDKTCTRDGREEDLIGSMYVPRRISKADYHTYDSPADALEFLRQEAAKHVDKCRQELTKAELTLEKLEALIAEGEKE